MLFKLIDYPRCRFNRKGRSNGDCFQLHMEMVDLPRREGKLNRKNIRSQGTSQIAKKKKKTRFFFKFDNYR